MTEIAIAVGAVVALLGAIGASFAYVWNRYLAGPSKEKLQLERDVDLYDRLTGEIGKLQISLTRMEERFAHVERQNGVLLFWVQLLVAELALTRPDAPAFSTILRQLRALYPVEHEMPPELRQLLDQLNRGPER